MFVSFLCLPRTAICTICVRARLVRVGRGLVCVGALLPTPRNVFWFVVGLQGFTIAIFMSHFPTSSNLAESSTTNKEPRRQRYYSLARAPAGMAGKRGGQSESQAQPWRTRAPTTRVPSFGTAKPWRCAMKQGTACWRPLAQMRVPRGAVPPMPANLPATPHVAACGPR